jgi:hypothetical protein
VKANRFFPEGRFIWLFTLDEKLCVVLGPQGVWS